MGLFTTLLHFELRIMDNNDYRVFQILDEIDQDVNISQRHLADKLNISLGLVNSFIKRLVGKGYFKVVSIPKNRVKYILTPEGAAEKTRLTYNYIKYSYDLYKTSHAKIQGIFKKLAMSGVRSVYFYGATDIAEISYISLKGAGVKLSGIIDDYNVGEVFLGVEVVSIVKMIVAQNEKIIITANDLQLYSIDRLLSAGISEKQIITFDSY